MEIWETAFQVEGGARACLPDRKETKDSEAYRRGGEKRGREDQSDVGAIGKRKILSASAVMEREIIRLAF